jgi:hypothetical protein
VDTDIALVACGIGDSDLADDAQQVAFLLGDWPVPGGAAAATTSRAQPACGARTRQGTPCKSRVLHRGGRCRNHGGLSTGPRTGEGKSRSALNLAEWLRPPRQDDGG